MEEQKNLETDREKVKKRMCPGDYKHSQKLIKATVKFLEMIETQLIFLNLIKKI